MSFSTKNLFFQLICYYVSWFSSMLLAAQQQSWIALIIGCCVLSLQLFWQYRVAKDTNDLLRFVAIISICGMVSDSVMVWFNLIVYQDNMFYPYLCPPWIMLLWPVFAVLIHSLLKSLWARPILSAPLSSVGFMLAYQAGAAFGAATLVHGWWSAIAIGAIWMLALPAIMWDHNNKVNAI